MDYLKRNPLLSTLNKLDSQEITEKAKQLLRKPSHLRTQSELEYLKRCTLKLKCFWPYSYNIRHQLIKVLYYKSYRRGRRLMQTNEGGFYFIINGNVNIVFTDPSNKGATLEDQLSSGSVLDHDKIKNILKAVCKSFTELLYVSESDLNYILKVDQDITWNLKKNILSSHPIFSEWSDINAIAEASSFVKYPPNSIIIKDLSKTSDYVYVIIQGSCHVIQKLKMRQFQDYEEKRSHFVMPFSKIYNGTIVRKWVSLYVVQSGDIFGFGEGNADTCVLSRHYVKCLAISRHVLLKYDRYGKMTFLRDDLMRIFPSIDTIFGKFIERCQWDEYKKDVYSKIMSKEGTLYKLPPIVKTTGKYLDSSIEKI